ncbi:MAG: cytoplasmic protein, partial [Polyangiaceae bacterium]|nr:cytoplasmic protein [Polyangiaceae bacterium]
MSALSRRDSLQRIGLAAATFGSTAALAALSWDRHAQGVLRATGEPVVRDFRVPARDDLPQLVVASGVPDPAALTDKAIAAIGGMTRFVSRGDVVAIKPNIGWDRAPIH